MSVFTEDTYLRNLMIRGTFDDSAFVDALMVGSSDNLNRSGACCTGSLIAPHLVLSSGHCVRDELVSYGSTYASSFGPTFNASCPGDSI